MQPLGLAHLINGMLQPVRTGERLGFANSKREYLFGHRPSAFGASGWQSMNMFDQPEVDGLSEVRGHFDRVFEFAEAVIVRPERYVFGHTDEKRSLINSLKRVTSFESKSISSVT